eukprot:m.204275 g.204275  ORF g.204275 m.204275 type:complete len:369 (+) comp53862_c0_seq8:2390-3496(+)
MATSPLSSPSTTASHTTLQDRWSAAAAAVAPIAETPATTTTTTTTTTPVTTIPATTPTRQRKAHKLKARRMSPTMFRRDRPLPTSETDQFSVVSFNILADCLLRGHTSLYDYAGRFASYDYRRPLLFSQLAGFNADILVLQEMMFADFAAYQAHLADHGYAGVMQSQKSKGHHPVGNAVFFRTAKFSLAFQEHRSRTIAVGLHTKTTPVRCLCIADVHLEGNWNKHEARFNQLRSLLTSLSKHTFDSLLIAGDFNSELSGSIAKLLFDGGVEAGYTQDDIVVTTKDFSHERRFRSAYEGFKLEPTFFMPRTVQATVDHICYSTDSLVCNGAMEVIAPADRELIFSACLPNASNGSDHLPVGAMFTFLT